MNTPTRLDFPLLNSMTRISVLLALLLLQGCASLDKEECMVADWRLIGYQDGVAGKSAATVGNYRKDCAQHAVVPDLDAYQAGRAEGLQEYCKADNGYRLGRAGKGDATVCPSGLEDDFRAAYNAGRDIYIARDADKRTRARIKQLEHELYDIEEEKKHLLVELVAEGLSSSPRIQLLYDISELGKEKDVVEEELAVLHDRLADRQARLDSLTQHAAR